MLLKNLMEDKQLNLSRPFLSVRRISPTVASVRDETKKTEYSLPAVTHPPRYKSELKSGPVRNPGAVPFLWEQSPGKPKDESRLQIHVTGKPPIAPRLPPGRRLKDNQDPDKAHESQIVSKIQTGNSQQSTPSCINLDEKVKKTESTDCTKEMKQDKEKNESEDGDEAYMDALDKLSRTESFFLNCSVSGFSGFDEPEAKPSGTYLTDPQTRDFMIDRFLPAAKAMASEMTLETPHYAPRKQPAVQEQPRQLKKVENGDKRPQLRYGPSFALHYSQSHDNGEEENDDDCYDDGTVPYRACGLLPRFCLKSSFCLLNPIPGMSVRTRVPMSPARTQTSSSSVPSCRGFGNESKSEPVLSAHAYANGTSQNYENKAIHSSNEEGNNPEAVCLGLQNTSDHFQELLPYQTDASEVDLATTLAEKTLHLDTVYKVESPTMQFSSPTVEGPSNLHGDDEDHEILKKIADQKLLVDSSLSYFAKPVEDRASNPNIQKETFHPPPLAEKLNNGGALMASGQAQDVYPSAKPNSDVKQSTRKKTVRKEVLENSSVAKLELPVAPPLPKSPSDSWLCRTLPSLSSKNASSRSYVGTGISPKNQSCKTLSNDPKWETIVKTKGLQQHLQYPEELMALTPIPEAQ